MRLGADTSFDAVPNLVMESRAICHCLTESRHTG
jgi:hypothetical protein